MEKKDLILEIWNFIINSLAFFWFSFLAIALFVFSVATKLPGVETTIENRFFGIAMIISLILPLIGLYCNVKGKKETLKLIVVGLLAILAYCIVLLFRL